MATFNPGVNKTNDPTYTNSTRGTDNASLQPLANVPDLSTKYVQPDYKANRTAGVAAEGLGEVGKAGLTLTDNIIKQNIDDDLHQGIDKIRDSFGVAQAADQSSGIAQAVGAGGAEGVSLAQADKTAGQPVAINKLGNKVEGLTEAYRQGGLSNSAYFAKLEAYVREVRTQYPGYRDVIDEKVAGIVGTTPANALRSALLSDVTELQKKVQAGADKWTTYERTNAQYIYTAFPNYDQMKAAGQAPSPSEVEGAVGKLQARDYSFSSRSAALAATSATDKFAGDRSEALVTERASDIAGHMVVTTNNILGIKSPADFTKLLQDVQSGARKPLTPDELTAAKGVLAQMKQQYNIQFDKTINQPLSTTSTETHASRIGNPTKIANIRDLGSQPLKDLEDGLLNDKYGVSSSSANWNKATLDAAEGDMLRSAPVMAAVKVARGALGDQGLVSLQLASPSLIKAELEGLRQMNWGSTVAGDSSVSQIMDTYKRNGTNDANLNRTVVKDNMTMIQHPDKFSDPTVPSKAVQHLFGPGNRTLIDRFDDKSQIQFFNDAVSPTMTKAISKMDKGSQQTYINWANDSFVSVFEAQVAKANQTATNYKYNGNLSLAYDPEGAQFVFTGGATASNRQGAQNGIEPLNSAMRSMKDIFKLQGRDATDELYRLLPIAGVEPGTPLYSAIQKEFIKKQADAAPGK